MKSVSAGVSAQETGSGRVSQEGCSGSQRPGQADASGGTAGAQPACWMTDSRSGTAEGGGGSGVKGRRDSAPQQLREEPTHPVVS